MHEVLVNRLGGLSLPRKSVVRLTDRPDMTLDVYRGRKTTNQQQQQHTHIPPSSSKLLTDRDFDFYEEIEQGIKRFKNMGKTFIVGDLNSRTGQLSDVLEFDKYLDIEEDFDDDNIEYNE